MNEFKADLRRDRFMRPLNMYKSFERGLILYKIFMFPSDKNRSS